MRDYIVAQANMASSNTVKPTAFQINPTNDLLYYNSKELQEYDPVFYYGCKTKPRNIIVKKAIPESEYVYANLKSKEWKMSSADCKKAQLLISKSWVDKHLFKIVFTNSNSVPDHIADTVNTRVVEEEEEDEKEEKVPEEAPPLLHLNDKEKFHDSDGTIIEIETRGEKNRNKIYFKAADVSKGFGMDSLDNTLLRIDRGYERNVDYKTFFIRDRLVNDVSPTIKKCLYLTYHGLLRVLFVSRNKHVKKFQDWAEECLFTIQMGSKEDKIKLGTNILSISPKTYKAVFDTYANKFPCIYLLSLGKVELLRATFNIDAAVNGELTVYKYGFTDDLSRRVGEHDAKYGKMKNVTVTLSTFHIIDTKYTSEAESEIREMCDAFGKKLITNGHNELIVLTEKELSQLHKQYKRIGNEFAGATTELQDKITELKEKLKDCENTITHLKISHKAELLEKDIIIQHEKNEKNALKAQLDTNQLIYKLEKQNLELQIQIVSKVQ